MGHHADHQRPRPVRVIRLTPTRPGTPLRNHAVNRNREARHASDGIARPVRSSTASTKHGKARYDHENVLGNRHELQPLRPSGHTELNRLGAQVTIDLVPDGTSQVTVTRHTPLPDAAIRQALSEAGGYQLTTP
jgi:hypothetical protein